jgi:ATP-dependent helicase YprA (DUF1998 family)
MQPAKELREIVDLFVVRSRGTGRRERVSPKPKLTPQHQSPENNRCVPNGGSPITLHRHQSQAVARAAARQSFVVTTVG